MFWPNQVVTPLSKVNKTLREDLWNHDREAVATSEVEAMQWLRQPERGKWTWTICLIDPDQLAIDEFLDNYYCDSDTYLHRYEVRWSFEKLDDALMFKLIWC